MPKIMYQVFQHSEKGIAKLEKSDSLEVHKWNNSVCFEVKITKNRKRNTHLENCSFSVTGYMSATDLCLFEKKCKRIPMRPNTGSFFFCMFTIFDVYLPISKFQIKFPSWKFLCKKNLLTLSVAFLPFWLSFWTSSCDTIIVSINNPLM